MFILSQILESGLIEYHDCLVCNSCNFLFFAKLMLLDCPKKTGSLLETLGIFNGLVHFFEQSYLCI